MFCFVLFELYRFDVKLYNIQMFQLYNARIEVGGKKRNWYVHIWVDIVKIPAIYYASNFVWIEEIDFNSGFAESHNVIFSSGQQILQPSSRSIGKQTSIIHSYLSCVCQGYLQTKPFAWQIYWHNVPRILRVFTAVHRSSALTGLF